MGYTTVGLTVVGYTTVGLTVVGSVTVGSTTAGLGGSWNPVFVVPSSTYYYSSLVITFVSVEIDEDA